ncbi:MAG TPA: glycosyltransferase family 4 protein [Ktedonobacteraceae bacterium]|nr:glycosyltransferase family 4 protein [Ktedonobacteraceae bacterium]
MSDVRREAPSDVASLLCAEAGGRPARTASADRLSLSLMAPFNCTTGYGSMGEYLALGLTYAGVKVNPVPLRLHLEGMTDEFREVLRCSQPDPTELQLYFHWLFSSYSVLELFRASRNIFLYTTWEANRLPASWVEQMNQVRAVIVPTRFNARACRDSGVTTPVEVVAQGIDPQVYHYAERSRSSGLTTLMVGPVYGRKHILTGIAAWKQVFAYDSQARLIIKTNYGSRNYIPDDPRIHFVYTNEVTRGIAHWYRQADVLLALGNEGFGLPLVEGMATGLPVIALDSEGQSDICTDARGLVLPVPPGRYEGYDASQFGCGAGGVCGIPDEECVAEQLAWVVGHREEARALGREASEWVLAHRNVWTMGAAVLEVLLHYKA